MKHRHHRLLLFIAISALATLIVACGTSNAAVHSELPEGQTRVQVREGLTGRYIDNPLAGFTIDLPPGWEAGEGRISSDGLSGWIAGPKPAGDENRPMLRWWIGSAFSLTLNQLQSDSRYDVSQPVIDGQTAILQLAQPEAIDEGPQVGIYFTHMPGGGQDTPSLRIEGDSRGFIDQEELRQVLTSVRYAELPELPEVPTAAITPGPDWTRVPVRSDHKSFTLMLPPGWKTEEGRGIDSLVGSISGDGITINYDFGPYSYFPYNFTGKIREGEYVPHLLWEERIGEATFYLVRPESSETREGTSTGVYVQLPGETESRWFGPRLLGTIAHDLSGEQQELVLAILRTAELETEPETGEPQMTLRAEPVEGRERRYRFIAEITGGKDSEIYCKSSGWGFDGAITELRSPLCVEPPADPPLPLSAQRIFERSHTFATAGTYTVVYEYADLTASVTVEVE